MKKILSIIVMTIISLSVVAQDVAATNTPVLTPKPEPVQTLAGYPVVCEFTVLKGYWPDTSFATILETLPGLKGDASKGVVSGVVQVVLVPVQEVQTFLSAVDDEYVPISYNQMAFLQNFLCGTAVQALRNYGAATVLAAGDMPDLVQYVVDGKPLHIPALRMMPVGTFESMDFILMPQLTFDFDDYPEKLGVVVIKKQSL